MAKGLQRMRHGCCSLFTPAPTSRKDCKLLTIKTELDLCTQRRAGGRTRACRAPGRPVVRGRPPGWHVCGHFPCWVQRGAQSPCQVLRTQGPHRGPRGQGRGAGGSRGSPAWGWEQTLRLGFQREQLTWAEILGSTGRGAGEGPGAPGLHLVGELWEPLGRGCSQECRPRPPPPLV